MSSRAAGGRIRWLRRLAAAGILAALSRAAAGQSGVWTSGGPTGGNVYCLAEDPSHPATLFAGTDQGVYKSDDGGMTWRASNSGISAYRVQTIAIDPVTPTTLYVGTITPPGVASVGIFKSTDGGASWVDDNVGLIDPLTGDSPVDVEGIAFDPRHPGTIWAGTRFSEIFESIDNGTTWNAKTFGGFNIALETSAFQFDPSNASTVLAASSFGLLRSTDGGSTWNTYGGGGDSFYSLVADPNTPATLYAGNTNNGTGIFKSTDSGAHWTAINKGLTVNQGSGGTFLPLVVALAINPSTPSTVYAATYGNGLFQSPDGGASWSPVNGAMRSLFVWTILITPGQPSTVFAGTLGAGVYISQDAARTFSSSNTGLILGVVNAIVSDSTSPTTLYAADSDGVWKSTDGAASWTMADNGLPVASVAALVWRPGSPQTLFAGTRGAGLFKSTDGAATWTASAQGLADSYVSSIAIDPSASSTLYAGTSHPYDGSNSERIYKSVDGGATWTQTSLDAQGASITSLSINPARTSQVIGVSWGSTAYFQSLDAGKSWSTVTTDPNCGGVNGVFFDSSGSTEYVAGNFGLCRSTDGGKTWAVTPVALLASLQTLSISSSSPPTVIAGAAPLVPGGTGGVFQSTDGGATWQPLGTGLELASVSAILSSPSGGALIVATRGNGVARLVAPQSRQVVEPPSSSGRQPRKLTPR